MNFFRKLFVLSCVGVAFLANVECDPDAASVTGTGSVGGSSVPSTSVISMIVTPTVGGSPRWNLVFTSATETCDDYDTTQSQGIAIIDEQALSISGDATDQTTVTQTSFTIGATDASASGNLAATFSTRGDDCSLSSSLTATAGTVTFSTYSTSEVAGTFSLTFGGDHVSGSFDTAPCDPQSFDSVAPGTAPATGDCAQSSSSSTKVDLKPEK